MIGKIVTLAMFGSLFSYYNYYRAWLQWDRGVIYRNYPGPCRIVSDEEGTEDITHIGNGFMLMSSGFNFDGVPGKVKAMDLSVDETVYDMNITNPPAREDFLGAPHGISAWKDPATGTHYLYVITHPLIGDKIEVFQVLNTKDLLHIKTLSDPSFGLMNDIVVVGKDQFYITYYSKYRTLLKFVISEYIHMADGKIMFFDGRRAREVVGGYFRPNGINVSPDKTTVYMAELGRNRLHAYKIGPGNTLTEIWAVDMGSSVDNIEVDNNTGDLWIGSHPLKYKITDFYNILPGPKPSQVLRVKIRDSMVDSVEEIFSDDGTGLQASTVATYVKGKLIIGTVFEQTMVCDVKYLS